MDLVNPFEEVVVFGKAYPVAWPAQGASGVKALLPTGRHVAHGNDLKHVHNSRGSGGPATRLEHYRNSKGGGGRASRLVHHGSRKSGQPKALERTHHTPRGFRTGPFKKAFDEVTIEKGLFNFGRKAKRAAQVKRSLSMAAGGEQQTARGLQMAANQKGVMPRTGRTGENVVAPSRYGQMTGEPRGEIGSRLPLTSRYYRHFQKSALAPRGVLPLRSAGGARPAGPLTGAVRRNQPVNSSIPTASKSGRRIG
jgi:hypothetical protein